MKNQAINILMFHSISGGAGPTCIQPNVFREQLNVLAECGYRGVALTEALSGLRGEGSLPARSVVLTFDDGYEDFASVVFPELQARGWNATVFLPAGKTGERADWDAPPGPRLMDWRTVSELAQRGVDFGGHGVSHADLTTLPAQVACAEIGKARSFIEDQTGCPVTSFAPPFGKSNRVLRFEMSRHYQAAVGTRLNPARAGHEPYDLPRIEMWYFRDPRRWQAYLRGAARCYFFVRRLLRRARGLIRLT